MQVLKKWQLFISVLALSACGGGGGSSSPTTKTNQSPTVSISGPTQMESGATISLSATASDADGSIASYSWTAESGAAVTLGDNKSATLSVTSANVPSDTTVKFTLTVTDNQGASTQSTVQVKIAAKKTSLTITGLVIDAVVPNANVTATIRDLSFTATADANGKYTLNLSVDDAHLNDLVLITADGGASKPILKLASQLPSMHTLLAQAGDDKQLDASENFSVNVTNVTTAEYSFVAQRATFYGIPFLSVTNDLQLSNIAGSVSDNGKYIRAALIKLVADMGVSLPAGVTTTYDLVMDNNVVNTMYTNIATTNPTLIQEAIDSIKKDASVVRPESLVYTGTFILSGGVGETAWELSFNDNNKGEANSRFGLQSFTWTRTNSNYTIQFDKPVDLKQPGFPGNWFATSLEISFNQRFGSVIYASMIMLKSNLGDNGQPLSTGFENKSVTILSVSKGLSLEKEQLVGEWVQGNDGMVRLFKLNSDGSVNSSRLDGTDVQTGLTWAMSNKGFSVFHNGKKLTDYYLLNDLGAGYSFAAMDRLWPPTDEARLFAWEGKLIKPQQQSIAKADLRGTYAGGAGKIYTLTNDDIIEGLSSRISPWNYVAAENAWTRFTYQDNSTIWLTYCDTAANKSCKVSRKTVVKILANDYGNYYLVNQLTAYDPDGKQTYTQDWMETWSRIPSPGYFDLWFDMSTYRREFFQQTAAGVKVWHFNSGLLEINDRSDDFSGFNHDYINSSISNGKLRYTRDGVLKNLELRSVSDEGIIVCEYNADSSCANGTEISLSNRTPAAITYKVSAGGSVEYTSNYAFNSDPMTLFGNVATFTIVPDQGYTVESVTGCGGKLEGFTYATAPVRDKCTITANFVKVAP
jgi:hypothetical protein